MPDILDELDTISRIGVDDEDEDMHGPHGTKVEGRESVIPPMKTSTAEESHAEARG